MSVFCYFLYQVKACVTRVYLKLLKLRNILHAQQYAGCLDMRIFFFCELDQLSFCWLGLLFSEQNELKVKAFWVTINLGLPGCWRCRCDGNVLFISFVNSKVSKCKFITNCHERSIVEFLREVFSKLSKLDLKNESQNNSLQHLGFFDENFVYIDLRVFFL